MQRDGKRQRGRPPKDSITLDRNINSTRVTNKSKQSLIEILRARDEELQRLNQALAKARQEAAQFRQEFLKLAESMGNLLFGPRGSGNRRRHRRLHRNKACASAEEGLTS